MPNKNSKKESGKVILARVKKENGAASFGPIRTDVEELNVESARKGRFDGCTR
jgi:hypothetical protein